MGKKQTYYRINNQFLMRFLRSKVGIVISGWIFQGFLYMNVYEKMYKICLESVFFIICFIIYNLGNNFSFFSDIVFSLISAHTLIWMLNGQVMTMFIHMKLLPNKPDRFIDYTDKMYENIISKNYISGAAAFGSLTRYNFKETSDIDVRLIMKDGLLNRFMICHFCFLERVKAFFAVYPIDIFAFEGDDLKKRMNPDEIPIVFWDPEGLLKKMYPKTLSYSEFQDEFRKRFL